MPDLRIAHTADLDTATRTTVRALLDDVFDDFSETDWAHSLGGLHVTAWEAGTLLGHAAVVQRVLLHQGIPLRTGYVEGVAVRVDRQRHGIGAALMTEIERIVRGAYELGALGASDAGRPFYARRGWLPWQGKTSVLTPDGIRATEDGDGGVYVLPVSAQLDLAAALTCDWRSGDVW